MDMTEWIARFLTALIQCGLPERQAGLYLPGERYYQDAQDLFESGLSPEEAATAELILGEP